MKRHVKTQQSVMPKRASNKLISMYTRDGFFFFYAATLKKYRSFYRILSSRTVQMHPILEFFFFFFCGVAFFFLFFFFLTCSVYQLWLVFEYQPLFVFFFHLRFLLSIKNHGSPFKNKTHVLLTHVTLGMNQKGDKSHTTKIFTDWNLS